MCPQASRFLALSFHSFKPIFLRSMDTSSSHLIFGLPLLVAYSFPYNIFFWNCGVLHSFYVTKPPYSLAFNEPDDVLPTWLWLLIRRFVEFSIIRFLSLVHIFSARFPFQILPMLYKFITWRLCVWLNMFRAALLQSSGAYNCTRSLWFNRWGDAAGALLVVVCQTTTNNAPDASFQR